MSCGETNLGTQLSSPGSASSSFQPSKCIICQKSKKCPVTSTANGRIKIIEAASIRKDIVHERLIVSEETFVYHMDNDCYKRYVMKKTLEKLKMAQGTMVVSPEDSVDELEPKLKRTRSSNVSRTEPSSGQDIIKLRCIICSKTQHARVREKFRMCESTRAQKFLNAALHLQDDVYTRVADLEDEKSVFGADLFYHKLCLESYLQQYARAAAIPKVPKKSSGKRFLFQNEVDTINNLLQRRIGIPLSDIRDLINDKHGADTISNKEVKLFMVEHFHKKIQFCESEQANESSLVFSSDLKIEDVVKMLRSLNTLKVAAQTIRKCLLETDFGLEDKFCDSQELHNSWKNMMLPAGLSAFFSVLFNINQTKLLADTYADVGPSTPGENEFTENINSERKIIKLKALYQMMYYNVHNGRRKTPLHLMAAHNIYDKCKSRELITSLNRIGVCTSYNKIQRERKCLAQFTFKQGEQWGVPIPSHFSKDEFTVAAFDNFDHADRSSPSGMLSNHDTVTVLFQEKPSTLPSKPRKSETCVSLHDQPNKLPCQELRLCNRGKKVLVLPASFTVSPEDPNLPHVNKDLDDLNFVLSALRSDRNLIADPSLNPTWAGCRSLLSDKTLPIWHVGFLPYLPYPVTKYDTVFTALCNLANVADQLQQYCLPVFCDEGVYCIVTEILLKQPDNFQNLVPMMGGFHMAKAAMHCVGKYLKGSGIEDAFVETDTFGLKVTQSVLEGSHYVRAFRGLLIAAEAVASMQWEAFWEVHSREEYTVDQSVLVQLSSALMEKDSITAKDCLNSCCKNAHLMNDFHAFIKHASDTSNMCKYWNGLVDNVNCIKALIAADRVGDWEGHLDAVENLLPIFRGCDSINYLRYATYYLESMRRLRTEHPAIYEMFMKGYFVINESQRKFSGVSPDMKLEQIIQRAQKSSSGIIGQTRKVSYVSEWEVVYHEILAISNIFRQVTNSDLGTSESELHHELDGTYAKVFNAQVRTITDFLIDHGNPYLPDVRPELHNIITSVKASEAATQQLTEFYKNSVHSFLSFRKERFVKKSCHLSDPIKKTNLQLILTQTKEKVSRQSSGSVVKDLSDLQKNVDIARGRGIRLAQVMEHDLLSTNILFDGDYTAKPDKSVLVHELEKHFESAELNFEQKSDLQTALLVDSMSMIRRMPLGEFTLFKELLTATWKRVKSICQFHELHWIFDSYIENSIKEGERRRRLDGQPLEMVDIQEDTRIPVQRDRFWSSSRNKEKLQDLCRSTFARLATEAEVQLVLSGYVSCENHTVDCTHISNDKRSVVVPDLKSKIEEADQRLIPHIKYAIIQGARRSVVVSNDTDVFVLLIYYLPYFMQIGLQELWIMFGVGEKTRFLPLHVLLGKIGMPTCRVLLKAHILTGADSTSKIGSKQSALRADPELYLQQFGEDMQLSPEVAASAETYLVKVIQPKSICNSFNELRFDMYRSRKTPYVNLPPSSHSLLGHLQRCFFVIRTAIHLLDNQFEMNPLDFGWEEIDGYIVPEKQLLPLPDFFLVRCGCTQKCTGRCSCVKHEVSCTEFCKCKGHCSNLP